MLKRNEQDIHYFLGRRNISRVGVFIQSRATSCILLGSKSRRTESQAGAWGDVTESLSAIEMISLH